MAGNAELRVTEPPRPLPKGPAQLTQLGCTLVPPPRFVWRPHAEADTVAHFFRASFCSSDGMERFLVTRWDEIPKAGAADLAAIAEGVARLLHERPDIQDLRLTVEIPAPILGRPVVLVVAEGGSDTGAFRNGMLFLLDEHERTWSLSRLCSSAVPHDSLRTELEQAAHTFKLTDGSTGTGSPPEDAGAAGVTDGNLGGAADR